MRSERSQLSDLFIDISPQELQFLLEGRPLEGCLLDDHNLRAKNQERGFLPNGFCSLRLKTGECQNGNLEEVTILPAGAAFSEIRVYELTLGPSALRILKMNSVYANRWGMASQLFIRVAQNQ